MQTAVICLMDMIMFHSQNHLIKAISTLSYTEDKI